MLTYVGYKIAIDFNGSLIDTLSAEPEETRAIVRKDNGKFTMAHYCYHRFQNTQGWCIWRDDEFNTQFEAMIYYDLVSRHPGSKKWVFKEYVKHVNG